MTDVDSSQDGKLNISSLIPWIEFRVPDVGWRLGFVCHVASHK